MLLYTMQLVNFIKCLDYVHIKAVIDFQLIVNEISEYSVFVSQQPCLLKP